MDDEKYTLTKKEEELLSWMKNFYEDCELLIDEIYSCNYKISGNIKNEYARLKYLVRDKKKSLKNEIRSGLCPKSRFTDKCVSNIGEAAAFGFTESMASKNKDKLLSAVEEGRYRIKKLMNEYADF